MMPRINEGEEGIDARQGGRPHAGSDEGGCQTGGGEADEGGIQGAAQPPQKRWRRCNRVTACSRRPDRSIAFTSLSAVAESQSALQPARAQGGDYKKQPPQNQMQRHRGGPPRRRIFKAR